MVIEAIAEIVIALCALGGLVLASVAMYKVSRLRTTLNWLERENEKLHKVIEKLKQELGDLRRRVRRLGYDPNHKTKTGRLGELPELPDDEGRGVGG